MAMLLDNALVVGAAYSFRKIRAAYAGNCVKIRRDGASPGESDFGFVSDVVDTAGIASYIAGSAGSTGGWITIWYDQSTVGYNMIQATSGNQPQFIATGLSVSKPVARFDGSNDNLQTADTQAQTDFAHVNEVTIVSVCEQGAANAGCIWGSDNTAFAGDNHQFYLQTYTTTDLIYNFFGGASAVASFSIAGFEDTPHVLTMYALPSGVRGIEVDDTSIGTATFHSGIASGTTTYNSMIGQAEGYGANFLGDIAEVIVFKRGLSATLRTAIYDEVSAFYGI